MSTLQEIRTRVEEKLAADSLQWEPDDVDAIVRAEQLCDGLSDVVLHRVAGVARHQLSKRVEEVMAGIGHPTWCTHDDECTYDIGSGHPVDWETTHESVSVDSWTPPNGDHEIAVYVHGVRHPDSERDWPDEIWADHVNPGSMGGVALQVEDARRLAQALLQACDLAEVGS